jgi:hypothetical protein
MLTGFPQPAGITGYACLACAVRSLSHVSGVVRHHSYSACLYILIGDKCHERPPLRDYVPLARAA